MRPGFGFGLSLLLTLVACKAPAPGGGPDSGAATADELALDESAQAPRLRLPPRPGLEGPFVEPPLEQKPELIAHVVVAEADKPELLTEIYGKLRAWSKMPIGFPAMDQAADLEGAAGRWVLVAGKFARRAWAEDLARALKRDGFDARVLFRRYLHDRFRPAPQEAGWPKLGRVFAGMPGGTVPVLQNADTSAPGGGEPLCDGQIVEVLAETWTQGRRWFRLPTGFVPARRLLVDGNVFSGPFGRRAVLGLPLGCASGDCRWDYWLVGQDYNPRRLLKPGGERLPHAFSPDGEWLAYSDFEPRLWLLEAAGTTRHDLGPGISPAWGPGGRSLLYRGPGIKKMRDQVFVRDTRPLAEGRAPGEARQLFDLAGTPYYPKAMSTIPHPVDRVDGGPDLFTLFFRAAEKKGKIEIQRWGVIFTSEGRLVEKKGVKIAD